ncbi:DNA-binding protein WhiA [Mycoplasma sp. 1654_15]|uniref:DNA-binding protein WhiA n=1 Tax=Mycoplasma sp. 1654_15 TaxID=2725994 RepID=UPI0014494125|nr:DNA-binding protein WhiA [Mycoplasma sp. 1654_15]QJB70952.1 DNA-binding protein WhiA [Mycoplasma sp. 1654_15]
MTFTQEVKQEILSIKYNLKEWNSFLRGIIYSSFKNKVNTNQDFFEIRINKEHISTLIKQKLSKFHIPYFKDTKNKNWIIINKEDFDISESDWSSKSFLAGVFVGTGTISKLDAHSYHLEIKFYNQEISSKVQKKLENHTLNFFQLQRNNNFILYIKKSEQILDFLGFIGAIQSFKKLFNIKIQRDYESNANRLTNLDISNAKRSGIASEKHNKNYQFIIKGRLLHLFRQEEIIFFDLKSKEPNLSLTQMVEILEEKFGIKKTKSSLNHWLIKLNKIVQKYS